MKLDERYIIRSDKCDAERLEVIDPATGRGSGIFINRGSDSSEGLSAGRRWQLDVLLGVLQRVFSPNGLVPAHLTHKEVLERIEPFYKEQNFKLPSVDTIARARGRRKGSR